MKALFSLKESSVRGVLIGKAFEEGERQNARVQRRPYLSVNDVQCCLED